MNGYSEPIPCTNVCGFLDSVEMESIWNNGNKIVCSTASLDVLKAGALEKSYLRKVVPIGTIGFVEAVLQMGYGISKLIPTNIPQELQHDKYLHRKYCPKTKAANVGDIMKSWNVPKVFVKSAETIKSDIPDIICRPIFLN